MPDLGDLLSFDDFGGDTDWSWLDELANLGFDAGDLGNLVLDTETGQLVDIATLSPQDLAELDMAGSPAGVDPLGERMSPPVANVPGGPSGTSLSDQLRSRAADPITQGTEDFDPSAMADPSASIASAEQPGVGSAKGLSDWLAGLGAPYKGLAGLGADPGGGLRLPGLGGMMSPETAPLIGARSEGGPSGGASPALLGVPSVGVPDLGAVSGGGLPNLGPASRLGDPSGLADVLRVAATGGFGGGAIPMQGPIDAGPIPPKFQPLVLPNSPPMAGGAAPGAPPMSGLQRLLQERRG